MGRSTDATMAGAVSEQGEDEWETVLGGYAKKLAEEMGMEAKAADETARFAKDLLDDEFAKQQKEPANFQWYTGSDPDRRARSFRRHWCAQVAKQVGMNEPLKEGDLPEQVKRALHSRWPSTLEGVGNELRLLKLPPPLAKAWSVAHVHEEREKSMQSLSHELAKVARSALAISLDPETSQSLTASAKEGLKASDSRAVQQHARAAISCDSQIEMCEQQGSNPALRLSAPDVDGMEIARNFLSSLGASFREGESLAGSLDAALNEATDNALQECAKEFARCPGTLPEAETSNDNIDESVNKFREEAKKMILDTARRSVTEVLSAPSVGAESSALPKKAHSALETFLALRCAQGFGNEGLRDDDQKAPAQTKEAYRTTSGKRVMHRTLAFAKDAILSRVDATLPRLVRRSAESVVSKFVPKKEIGDGTLDEGLLEGEVEPPRKVRVGYLRERFDPLQPERIVESHLEVADPIASWLSGGSRYTVSETGAGEGAAVFSSGERGEVVYGTVVASYKAAAENPMSEAYITQFRERNAKANQPRTTTRVQSLSQAIAKNRVLPTTSNLERSDTVQRKGAKGKERMGEEELKEKLFALFARERFWSLKSLQSETRQPADNLKKVLSEIATQGTHGPQRNKWSLKPHFRTSRQQQQIEEDDRQEA